MLSSHVKISPLLWLHTKSCLSYQKTVKVKLFGISLVYYIINRSLHGRLEIRNFSSHAEKIIHSFAALRLWNIFHHSKRNILFRTSARPWNILYIHCIKLRHKRSRQHNNIDSRINITTFFNLQKHVSTVHPSSSVLYILKSLLNLNRTQCYKVHYIALAILRTEKFKISDA